MKLEKAIELLEELKDQGIDCGHYDAEDAMQLGIEALKKVKAVREGKEWVGINPLPGETEE